MSAVCRSVTDLPYHFCPCDLSANSTARRPKPAGFASASPATGTIFSGVWFTGNSRPVRLKPEQSWECKSPHADQFRIRHRTSAPGLPGEQLILARGWWGRTTRIRHGHVVKRE